MLIFLKIVVLGTVPALRVFNWERFKPSFSKFDHAHAAMHEAIRRRRLYW